MEITLDTRKTLEQNAAIYFEKAKKAKRKIDGLKKALEHFNREKEELLKKKEKIVSKEEQKIQEKKEKKEKQRAKQWYEKFHWFTSSEGFLCIGGKDATTNEIVIKKHTDKDDIVFHTEAPGSPFFVIKTEGKKPGEATLNETAIATASYSRAWKLGLSSVLAYYVSPEQVSKKALAGEYLQKGGFMIYGKRTSYTVTLELGIGLLPDGRIMGGPVEAVKKNCGKMVIVVQGKQSKSDIAKKIQKVIGGEIDGIISALPAGEFEVKII